MVNVGQEPDERDRPAEEGSVPDSVPDQSAQPPPAVRFKSTIEEIVTGDAESDSPAGAATATPFSLGEPGDNVTPEQIRHLSDRLKACPLQERRMNIFSYEPFSLPASRTASHEDDSREPSREPTRSSAGRQSPLLNTSVRASEMHTPPLTPAGTASGEGLHREAANSRDPDQLGRAPDIITPLDSAQDVPSPSSPRPSVQRGASADQASPRPVTSDEKEHSHGSLGDHRRGLFSLSTANNSPTGSVPVSRETSPSRAAAASQFYTRHAPPPGEVNDPYAANKRQAQKGIDPRFVFSRKKKGSSPSSSTISLPRASTDKRLGRHKDEHLEESFAQSKNSSMADLKRFFKLGPSNKAKRTASPAASIRSNAKTPPGSRSSQIPFGDDHGLTSKYGKLGKVLGAGAGGSVRLMKRAEDSVVFAVKEFRPRHSYETEREYVKKLTAEYCMGSSLHHGNIIETLDIVQEKGKWYEVMEYAPYDLFAIVMTGKMSREEVSCCFLQILSGVTYLHSMGLAHRDLKLDNVVVSDRGIMKIIDFGSAHVYRYPFENSIVPAGGIVGSDPYLAPEVYDEKKYDPQAVDIWSLAIIYCCMTLRRFPWKVPRLTDNSFRLFAADPSPGHDPKKLILPHASSTSALSSTPARDYDYPSFVGQEDKSGHEADKSTPAEPTQRHEAAGTASTGSAAGAGGGGDKKEVVRGPWRILRLLPRESRNVIEGMLAIDPKKRAKMSEILEDPWVANTVICRQIEAGVVVNSDDHTHVLEPPSSAASAGK
ncbi:kinase-like domain-containing protein [Lasiosphaeria ovina]|uniref:non-specific serine/threonine protein kinase n=1 Tax=Lasiosphaeria ovina TaxID=92902 RepID=A0AAE0K3F5_9PEZI|nr:kinase-like domain-containing protein [Lasiosphaeria ovina]